MSIRMGWSRSRPKSRRPGKVAGGLWLFELLKIRDGKGRHYVIGFLSYAWSSRNPRSGRHWPLRPELERR